LTCDVAEISGAPVPDVRLFASLRELAGSSRVRAEGSTVGEVVENLSLRYGERFGQLARSGSFVVDGERAGLEVPLSGDEEVALLPPVSGGSELARR
jgi:molybdopterin synthase catalytic subunit/molybdopterin synthase sulfur carrier subunit